MKTTLLALAALVALPACASGSGTRPAAGPSANHNDRTNKVVEIARAHALRGGCLVVGYVADAALSGGEWMVTFHRTGEKQAPGDFCTVYVDDRTMTPTRLIAGK